MCNITVTDVGADGITIKGHNNVLERCTVTECGDEAVIIGSGSPGGTGHVVAFCRIGESGSAEASSGRGMAVWYGTVANPSEAIVVGNYIGGNLRGLLCGDYGDEDPNSNFMDFRNNLVTRNFQTYGIKVSTPGRMNIIDNTITNHGGAGISYSNGCVFYRSDNVMWGNTYGNELFEGSYTELSAPVERLNTPYPNWLENVVTPKDAAETGMGSGKCQCLLCRK
jgi:hypothetical protein